MNEVEKFYSTFFDFRADKSNAFIFISDYYLNSLISKSG